MTEINKFYPYFEDRSKKIYNELAEKTRAKVDDILTKILESFQSVMKDEIKDLDTNIAEKLINSDEEPGITHLKMGIMINDIKNGVLDEKRCEQEQQLINILKEKGSENPEAISLLISWTIEQKKQVERSDDPEAPIQLNLRRARLYLKAGYVNNALENFEAAKIQANNEQREELCQAITEEMKEIKKVLK